MNYIEKCLINKKEIDNLDYYLNLYEEDNSGIGLQAFLGFTNFEFKLYLEDIDVIKYIVQNRHDIEPRNQFLALDSLILELASGSKKKSAYLKISIPEILANKLLKQIGSNNIDPIRGLRLSYLDKSL